MKRITLSFLTLCLSTFQLFNVLTLKAEPVSKQAALYTAQNYMLAKGKTINVSQRPHKAASTGQDGNEDAYYYVFNAGNNGGYVIVSGDDRVEPILGYVEQGSFDPNNIPENMRSWLQGYADEIKYIIDNDIKADSPLLKKRNKIRGTKHSVAEMLTTRWNQGSPYNILCPKYYKKEDGTRHYPATGCTATAMAQVMNFYRYPAKTKAVIPSHSNTYTYTDDGGATTKTATVSTPAIPRNTVIDWDNMRDTYSWNDSHVPNAQDTAVAQLMLMCGQSVKMGWGPSSGANFSAEAYIKYFGFDNSAYVGERRDYFIDDWFDMLYNEIVQGYPVLFSGFSSGGGHAFVLDGFDGDNLFHLNWGWGGGSNGWFLVGILNPGDNSGIGASSSSDGYSMSQRALFNLRLPDNNSADTYLFIKDVSTVGNISIRATFENRTGASGSFNAGIVRIDENGDTVLVGTQVTLSSMENNTSQTKSFTIKNKLTEGTYKLSPASKAPRNKSWRPKYNMRNHYIEAVVDASGNLTLTPVDINNGNDISIDTIVFPGTRIVGQEQEVKVTYRNNSDEYFKEVRMFASQNQQRIYTESRSIVAVRKGETVEVSYFWTPDTIGQFNLWFCTGSDGSGEVGTGTMEIIDEAQAVLANLSVSSYSITNQVNNIAYGKRLVGKASIKNNARTDFHGSIRLQIWNQPNSSGSAWSGASKTYSVDILAGKVATVDFDFDNLSENNKYYLSASYVNQSGSLGNGGVWDLGGWEMKAGIATWKTDGTIVGKAHSSSMSTLTTVCGVYADCSKKITRMLPNKNPNTIYAFGADMEVPASLDTTNVVSGNHANHINLFNDHPYYLPASFDADSASFTYTFAETEAGTGWHAFTMPFDVDSIFLDDNPVSLEDTLNHFWIYEFAAESDDGEPIFAPATTLRGGTAYIIAADAQMAGRSLVCRSLDVPFFKAGSDKMLVTSSGYKFHGNTYAPKLKNCYVLNAEGTAFEYTTTNKTLGAMEPYFTTPLPDSLRLESIVLPEIPVKPINIATLDEAAVGWGVEAGTFDVLTLRRPFEAGWNTICLPFDIEDVEEFFGEGAQAYEFSSLVGNELDFVATSLLSAGYPYIINLPNAITEDFVLENITIEADNIECKYVSAYDAFFCGTYTPIEIVLMQTRAAAYDFYVLNADGTLSKATEGLSLNGFRAYFKVPENAEVTALHLFDSPDAIGLVPAASGEKAVIYNISGQRINKARKGINIMNGKKIAVK